MLRDFGPWHMLIIAVVVLVLFGSRKLPDAARSLGRSLRIFKAETKGLREDDVEAKAEAKTVRQPLPPPAEQPAEPTRNVAEAQPHER